MDDVKRFMIYFKGLNRGYGTYKLKTTEVTGEKVLGKPATKSGTVTADLWQDHLDGTCGLGICPIMDGDECFFGAIDIDIYGTSHKALLEKIEDLDLPLMPFLTKSGGIHCFCFVNEPVPATLMKQKLEMMSAYLGFGDAEIFPKQTALLTARSDIGSWINMPYFNKEDSTRYLTDANETKFTCDDFFEKISLKRWSKAELAAFTLVSVKEIKDGPPCLQNLLDQGFIEGHRNQGLFNLAIYLKKYSSESWETLLDEYNIKFADPPLLSKDIQAIVKSVRKKDYGYTCNKPPLKSYCNMAVCRGRSLGIGGSGGTVVLTNLTKYDSEPPIWFADVEDSGRIELATEDIQSQARFQRRCMESLNTMPVPYQTNVWQSMIQDLLKHVTIIEAASDSSPRGLLFEYLERFCTSRLRARTLDEVLLGKPWTNDTHHIFRLSDFYTFLDRMKFREFKVHQIGSLLRETGGEHAFLRIKGKGVNIWKYPRFDEQTEDFDIPEILDEEVM